MIEWVSWIVAGYAAVCIGGYFLERQFMYFPDRTRVPPAQAGLEGVEEIEVPRPDGKTLVTWFTPGGRGKPTILYFHGNAGNAAGRADKIGIMQAAGYSVLYVNARGYGGSTGRPSEAANVADAIAVYDYLRGQGRTADDVVVYGESIGSGVAVQVAAAREVRAVVLEAPLTSTVDVGRRTWWFLPLRLIMSDQYRNIDHIRRVTAPLLIVHGAEDAVIPVAQAERLHAVAPGPKALVVFPEGGHNDLFDHGAWEKISIFLETLKGR